MRKANKAFKEFNEGKLYDVYFDGFVYVQDNLIFAYTISNEFFCNNEIPHLTLLCNGYLKPKHSNSVLSALFSTKDRVTKSRGTTFGKEITIEGYQYYAYVLSFKEKQKLCAEMASFME